MGTILIVEDHLETCRPLLKLLKLEGLDGYCVDDGEQALAWIRQRRPDLVLLDVMMPRMSGIDLLRTLRSDPDLRDLPVIMYSALGTDDTREEAARLGAADYLIKGKTSWDELLNRIGGVIGH